MAGKKAPWQKPAPKQRPSTKMTSEEVEVARARALAAGRPYPNLVDNLWVIRQRRDDLLTCWKG